MSIAEVLARYEALAALSGQMAEAARLGEWDVLVDLERQRAGQVAAVRSLDAATTLDAAAKQRKSTLIEAALAPDAEIRSRVQAWLNEHELSMQSNAQELRLLREYGR